MRRLAACLLTALCLLAAASGSAAARALPAPVACPGCWAPAPSTSWQWQLSGTVQTSVAAQMYDIDMFETMPALVARLHGLQRHVVCYIDAGAWERWRPDAGRSPPP